MKKIKLNLGNFDFDEILTRDQLKNILGGDPPTSSGSGSCGSRSCSVYANGQTWMGTCSTGWGGGSGSVMPCSCATAYGVYSTGSGTYSCGG